ncbi:N-acetylglucosamine-6-phosphate deacetylase [Caldalkalibacillus uzonensis]|uniref:N-acetylglucosamine-6-phosphate deacetylase n=1 Tax=Caldalkalibacillus uzonensis TaxID=353224 RepID=A0ABU0CTA8_9BACI|nr:N-acetylglucosamine-6-phosphate deacetylase [Caldalkalibacillus uzonensis]
MAANSMVISGGTIVTGEKVIHDGHVIVEGDKIAAVSDTPYGEAETSVKVIHLNDSDFLFPGFIDVHIHGVAGADVMDGTREALQTIAQALPAEGTTSFLATTITQSDDAISQAVQNVHQYMNDPAPGAEVLGIHLEGPFISERHPGAQPKGHIVPPCVETFAKWEKLSGEKIRLVTLAPEEDEGLALVKYLKGRGVIISVGHSHATYAQVSQAVQYGLSHAAHLFNAMRPLHHREPGVVGAVFLHPDITAEIIFDHVHVKQEVVQLAYNIKGPEKMILITDAIRAKGLGDGAYDLGGQTVTVKENRALLADGTLAGSMLKMNEAVRHASRLNGCDLVDLVKLSSLNAAHKLGIAHRKGSIAPGKDADLVVLDQDFNVQQTICRGQLIYDRK